jgi:hypothetical protein
LLLAPSTESRIGGQRAITTPTTLLAIATQENGTVDEAEPPLMHAEIRASPREGLGRAFVCRGIDQRTVASAR